jgi:hypothetical protein
MKASELQHLWKRQQPIELSPENIGRITATVDAVDRKFRRKIWWRDLREIGAALVLAAFFGFVGQTWFRWLAVASCLFVAAWIVRSRIMVRAGREIPSVTGRLQQMIRETETQIQLTRTLLWWYLLPCVLAMLAITLDSPPRFNLPFLSIYGSVGAAMGVAIYWLNQRYVRKVLEPRRENLRHALAELSQQS